MLNIYFGVIDDALEHIPAYFEINFEDNWITTDFSRKVIKYIDNADLEKDATGDYIITHPTKGILSPIRLSAAVQTLILLEHDNSKEMFNASLCNNNCAKWILDIASRKDITINLRHILDFGANTNFEAKILNSGIIIHNTQEYLKEVEKWLG